MDVRPTWVDRLPGRLRWQRAYAMLQPLAFGGLRIRDADTLLSFASFGAKAVPRPPAGATSATATPPRFLWGPASGIDRARLPAPARRASAVLERYLRRWDLGAARRVSRFITQSRYVAGRIRRVYGREAEVIPPPVDVQRFAAVTPRDEGYFLIVSRFEAYKRIDLAIRACSAVGVPLRIVGAGVDEARLRDVGRRLPAHVRFLGAPAGPGRSGPDGRLPGLPLPRRGGLRADRRGGPGGRAPGDRLRPGWGPGDGHPRPDRGLLPRAVP